MTSPKNTTKSASAKPAAPAKRVAAAKPKAPAKVKAPAKAAAVKKPEPTAKQAAAKPVIAKAPPKAAARAKKAKSVPPEQRRNYIEMAAYYIAERRGFAPGNPLEDWVQAEAEIDRLLAQGRLGG
ncbi:MAG: DUF2934 domain-containing protein [Pseudomonadota bacterium]